MVLDWYKRWIADALQVTEWNGRDPREKPAIHFDDDFAASHAHLSAELSELVSGAARLPFYNDQCVDTLESAIRFAVHLGCPKIPYSFPIEINLLNNDAYLSVAAAVKEIGAQLSEGSFEWLCIVAYLNWARACHLSAISAPPSVVAEAMFLAGATAREIELSQRNRLDARRGKSTLRAAQKGGRMQNAQVLPQTLKLIAYMQKRIEGGATVSEAARWAAQAKIGRSFKANRAAWYRYQKKV